MTELIVDPVSIEKVAEAFQQIAAHCRSSMDTVDDSLHSLTSAVKDDRAWEIAQVYEDAIEVLFEIGSMATSYNSKLQHFLSSISASSGGSGSDLSKYTPSSIGGSNRMEPMSFQEADESRANPHYTPGKNGQYENNCQSCVVANELRRRGYNVEAWGFSEFNETQNQLACDTRIAWFDPETGMHPDLTEITGKNGSELVQNLDDFVKEGERYTIQFGVRNTNHGHIECLEKINGSLVNLDPQSGTVNNTKESIMNELSIVSRRNDGQLSVRVLRIDNKIPNVRVASAVVKPRY